MQFKIILFGVLSAVLLLGANSVEANDLKLHSHEGMAVKADVIGAYKYQDGFLTLSISKLDVFPNETIDKPIYVRSLKFVVLQAESVNELSSRHKALCGSIPVDQEVSHNEPFLLDPFTIRYNFNGEFNVLKDTIALKICLGTGEECRRHTWAFDVRIDDSDG